jgi:diacylglycerol kinase family enzyme
MQFGVIVDPLGGERHVKRKVVDRVAAILGPDTPVEGWETASLEEVSEAASRLATGADVLVVAGNDRSFSEILNTAAAGVVLSYIPLGAGNLWRKALKLEGFPGQIARAIREGRERSLDLILCNGKRKGIFAGIGFEGRLAKEYERRLKRGITGPGAWAGAAWATLRGGYGAGEAVITLDGESVTIPNPTALTVTKTPCYGYALGTVPGARETDGRLHLVVASSAFPATAANLMTNLLGGARSGAYRNGYTLTVKTSRDTYMQIDGAPAGQARDFTFEVLPRALTVRT